MEMNVKAFGKLLQLLNEEFKAGDITINQDVCMLSCQTTDLIINNLQWYKIVFISFLNFHVFLHVCHT